VAAYADQHVRVLKEPATDGRLVTKAEVLDREDTRVSPTGRCSVAQYSAKKQYRFVTCFLEQRHSLETSSLRNVAGFCKPKRWAVIFHAAASLYIGVFLAGGELGRK
jgi:hypothetical protein